MHAFCVSPPNTGTMSLARIFEENYASEHEPEAKQLIQHVLSHPTKVESAAFLKKRSKRLYLDMESNHALGACIEPLVEIFANARFIVCLREPISWLHSMLKEHSRCIEYAQGSDRIWLKLLQYYRQTFAPGAPAIKDNQIFTHDDYLRMYEGLYKRIFLAVPTDRIFVCNLACLEDSIPNLAAFLGIDPAMISVDKIHSHRSEDKTKLLDIDKLKAASSQLAKAQSYYQKALKTHLE